MGIPKFLKTLIKRYPLIEQNIRNNSYIPPIDNLYLDINIILHLLSHSREHNLLALTIKKTNEDIYKETCAIINQIVQLIKPKSFLMIVVDGVCPIAKISNQFISRYISSLFKFEEIDTFLKQLGMEKKNDFDGNQIFPGTDFMNQFEQYLDKYIYNKRNEKEEIWSKIDVLFSGTNVPGEGEYKIMEQIREQKENEKNKNNDKKEIIKYCIFSGDSDFILLSLLIHEPNIIILKSDPLKNKYNFECNKENNNLLFNDFIYISLLRQYLDWEFIDIKEIIDKSKYNKERFYEDFVLLCFLLGNDYIPGILTLDKHYQIFEMLLESYKKTIIKTKDYLINNGKINFNNFKAFINQLANYEFDYLEIKLEFFEIIKNQKKEKMNNKKTNYTLKEIFDCCCNSNEALENKEKYDKLKYVMNSNKNFINKINDIINDTIMKYDSEYNFELKNNFIFKFKEQYKTNKFEAEKMYYNEKFKIDLNEKYQNEKEKIITNYLAGIQWNLYYYKGFLNWNWNYLYNYAPLLISLSRNYNYNLTQNIDKIICENNNGENKEGKPLSPLILQCLSFHSNLNSCSIISPDIKDKIYNIIPDYHKYQIKIENNGFPYHSQTTVLIPKLKGEEIIKLLELNNDENNELDKEYLYNNNKVDKIEYKRKRKNEIFKGYNDNETSDTSDTSEINIKNDNKININNNKHKNDYNNENKKPCKLRARKKIPDKGNNKINDKNDKNDDINIDIYFPSFSIKKYNCKETIEKVENFDGKKSTYEIKTLFIDLPLSEEKVIKRIFDKDNENKLLNILKENYISYGYPLLKLGKLSAILYKNTKYRINEEKIISEAIPSNIDYYEKIKNDYMHIGLEIEEPFCLIEVIPIIYINNGHCVFDEDYQYLVPIEITSLLYNKEIKGLNLKNKNDDKDNKYIKFKEDITQSIKYHNHIIDKTNNNKKNLFLYSEDSINKEQKNKNNKSNKCCSSNKKLKSAKKCKRQYKDNDDDCEINFKYKKIDYRK